MAKGAKASKLAELHEMLAEMFMGDIRICKEEGIPMSAADKGVIVTFLKNNNITADVDDSEMQTLKQEFEDELKAKRQARAAELLAKQEDGDALQGVF
jgi:hypothetical protein